MVTDADIRASAEQLVATLVDAGRTMAAAESCTGGWIAKTITDIPGSSAVFGYGIVSYSNDAKASLLGVSAATLEAHGAVSEATVKAMSEGVVRVSGAGIGVAVSGIAGPDGGSEDKPVGSVWFAWTTCGDDGVATTAELKQFPGDRDAVRRATVLHALEGIRGRLRP